MPKIRYPVVSSIHNQLCQRETAVRLLRAAYNPYCTFFGAGIVFRLFLQTFFEGNIAKSTV